MDEAYSEGSEEDVWPGRAADLEKRLERLGSLGVMPGSLIRLIQRRPSFILEVDQTSLAVEREVAEGIYVRPLVPGKWGLT